MDLVEITILLFISFLCLYVFYIDGRPKSNYDERLIFYLGEELYNTKHVKLYDYPNIIDVNNFKKYDHMGIKPNFDKPFEKLLEKTGYKESKF